jgi:methylmalonyl-CoA mutase
MAIENMKTIQFTQASLEDWQEKASASLKGKPIESLYTSTYEDITLKPLYTNEDIAALPVSRYPGYEDFRRGTELFGYQSKPWHIANRLSYDTLEHLQEKMDSALSKGQTAIAFEVKPGLFAENQKLIAFLSKFNGRYPFAIHADYLQAPMLAALIQAKQATGTNNSAHGFVAADPIGNASLAGGLPKEETIFFEEWSNMLEEVNEELPELKTVMVNAVPYHNAGANAVQELAIALSTGVFYIQALVNNGWDIKKALSKMVFHFSAGANFFMEIAKLRAARLLWNKVLAAYRVDVEYRKMVLSAETSKYTKTVFDPYVNILRTGNEAFTAVLGGVQYLHTDAFDEVLGNGERFSERIARNTQLVLKSEAHLEKTADPAGGSWYVESLTNQLAEKAWELFLEIDSKGGIYETFKCGWLQEEIAKTAARREKDIFSRKTSIIGTNVYANLSEQYTELESLHTGFSFTDKSFSDLTSLLSADKPITSFIKALNQLNVFTPIKPRRLAEPYEKLRFQAGRIAKENAAEPSVGLICLGELKKHKARADFIAGLLSAGGIHSVRSNGIKDIEEASEFISSQKANQFIICGDGADYHSLGPNFVQQIKKQHQEVKLYMAGLPEGEKAEWEAAGIEEFIHIRSNAFQILSGLLAEMEANLDAKA